jgi:outer membrane receptor for monomeric catechols
MFKIHFTNHFYFAQDTFGTLEAAKAYGKSKGFDFSVHGPAGIVGAWSVFGGYRDMA